MTATTWIIAFIVGVWLGFGIGYRFAIRMFGITDLEMGGGAKEATRIYPVSNCGGPPRPIRKLKA